MMDLLKRDLVVETKVNKFGASIEQKQSRALKAELTEKVAELLKETFDLDAVMTSEGLYLLIPNDNEGYIPVNLDLKMKPLDTDIDTLAQEYKDKQAEKAEKAEAKAKQVAKAKAEAEKAEQAKADRLAKSAK